ncbi:MAG: hypothetical protein AAB334_02750 [Patescibacteria group bacterium]
MTGAQLQTQHKNAMSKGTKTFPLGRNSKTGEFITVKEAKQHPNTTTVERIPKSGYGDTGNSKKK